MTVMFSHVRLLLPAPKSRGWTETGLEEIDGDLLEADFGTTSSESELAVTSG
jgi:hypothetical protein